MNGEGVVIGGVVVKEWVPATSGHYVDRVYTDTDIEELFSDEHCLVIALLRRAQKAEKRVAELEGKYEKNTVN